jgi:hypothetical protein
MCPDNSVTERSGRSLQGDKYRSGRLPIVVPGAACAVIALRGRPTIRKPAVEAAGAVDAENASTAPWKTAKNAVSHSYHRPFFFTSVT